MRAKAMAWAKEHDIMFPVVRPKGGNPLGLHTRDIPHLFIVKDDGHCWRKVIPCVCSKKRRFAP